MKKTLITQKKYKMKKLTKKQNDFMDISIQLADFKDWYLKSDEINGRTFAILNRQNETFVCGYGSKSEILNFIHGYRTALNQIK